MAQRMPTRVAFQGKGGVEELPPPGDERREVLAERVDTLAEQAEKMSVDAGGTNADAFEIENEIAQHFDADYGMLPPNKSPNHEYCWVQRDPKGLFGNRWFLAKQAEGWQRVTSRDPDAIGMEHAVFADGSIVVGDVILMRIRKERFEILQQRQDEKTRRLEYGAAGELAARAERHGVGIFDAPSPSQLREQIQARGGNRLVVPVSPSHGDRALRDGTLPGMPAPRR